MNSKKVAHNGHNFRSLTEARWAVFFECLKIPYEYEKKIFQFEKDLHYLPDFWLPQQKMWVEVKGVKPTNEESYKAVRLFSLTRSPVWIFSGFPKVKAFQDAVISGKYAHEVCNFGIYLVDQKLPDSLRKASEGTANETIIKILGLDSSDFDRQTQLISNAANMARRKQFRPSFKFIISG